MEPIGEVEPKNIYFVRLRSTTVARSNFGNDRRDYPKFLFDSLLVF